MMRVRGRHLGSAILLLATTAVIGGLLRAAPEAGEPFCPGGSHPSSDVVLCEDFEDPNVQSKWDIGSNRRRWPVSQFVMCTDDAFGFRGRCAAWSNFLVFDNAWGFYGYDGRRAFPPQSEFHVRWYQHVSDPYRWGSLEDKSVMLHDPANTITAYVATNRNHLPHEPNSGPGLPYVANYQDLDWRDTGGQRTMVNRFQNQGRNITLRPGHWYLFEWYVKLNTPGASDGVTKLWVDEATQPITSQTLRLHYTDMRWLRKADAGKQFGVVRLTVYHQRCDGPTNTCPPNGPIVLPQSHRWDGIVVSKRPIGPIAENRPTASNGPSPGGPISR